MTDATKIALTAAEPAPVGDVALDGAELWEILFGVLKGDVPDILTDDRLNEIAAAINTAFPRLPSPAPVTVDEADRTGGDE